MTRKTPFGRLDGGYHFEKWWGVGDVAGSQTDLTMQGLFLRAEIGF